MVTRLLWLTDLHLDRVMPDAAARLPDSLTGGPADLLLITGDISNASRFADDLAGIADAFGGPTYFVLGNHDHYGSSVAQVRDTAGALHNARWLPPSGVIDLGDGVALVGVDGWADGRFGDPLGTPLVLNDDRLITEVAAQESRAGKLAVKRFLADADAARLDTLLTRAIDAGHRHLIVATHVPPFAEGLRPGHRISHPHWLPLLVCRATGEVVMKHARHHPETTFSVLAGHSHVGHHHRLLSNLTITVAAARQGDPGAGANLAAVAPEGLTMLPFRDERRRG